jgi:hypothetical protein
MVRIGTIERPMFSKHFKIVALGAVLLHLADGLLATGGHSHDLAGCDHDCHHVAQHAGHHHHGDCADHHEDATSEEGEHSQPDHQDTDHCAACRHLAQATAHQFALVIQPTVEPVAFLTFHLEKMERSVSAHDYLSRGPPAIAL